MRNKVNTCYYFVMKGGDVASKRKTDEFPDWFLSSQLSRGELEDYRYRENQICDTHHPLPCGLDKRCPY